MLCQIFPVTREEMDFKSNTTSCVLLASVCAGCLNQLYVAQLRTGHFSNLVLLLLKKCFEDPGV